MANISEKEKSLTPEKGQSPFMKKFPYQLHRLLEQADTEGYAHIISWLPGNKAFKVHKKKEFAEKVLPKHFQTSTYKSFQRNLNLWGFDTVSKGPKKGECTHPQFLRDEPEKCSFMTRIIVKRKFERKPNHMLNQNMALLPTPSVQSGSTPIYPNVTVPNQAPGSSSSTPNGMAGSLSYSGGLPLAPAGFSYPQPLPGISPASAQAYLNLHGGLPNQGFPMVGQLPMNLPIGFDPRVAAQQVNGDPKNVNALLALIGLNQVMQQTNSVNQAQV